MKKFLCSVLSLIIILSLAACSPADDGSGNITVRGFNEDGQEEYVIENEYLILKFYPETTFFSITDKKSGVTWLSNPEDAATDNADGITKRRMQSLLVLEFSNKEGFVTQLDTFDFSINKGIYNYKILESGFEIYFTIGNIERTYYMPGPIPDFRMEEFIESMSENERKDLLNMYYRFIDIENLGRRDNEADIIAAYPFITEYKRIYVPRDTIQNYQKAEAEELFEKYGYTAADYNEDLLYSESDRVITDPVFNVTFRVELDGKRLKASVPYNEIEYNKNSPPVVLRVLPYLGAGGSADEGYMLVPDGSGAIINFNNGKHNQSPYSNSVYGWDEGLYREAVVNNHMAHFPAFGIEKNGSAMLCVIEEGASYATVRADVSGRGGSYNFVHAEYSLIHKETMDISLKSETSVFLFQRGLPEDEQIVQYYYFCDNNGYMGMAETYRQHLLDKYPNLQKLNTASTPVAVELIGAVNSIQHIAGAPVSLPLKLTSYKEAADIVNDLGARGFSDVNYRFTGWFNNSVLHSVPSNINLISELGSKKDFTNLVNAINNNNSDLFLEADFLYIRNYGAFNGFNTYRDAARYINRKRILTYPHSFVWYGEQLWMGGRPSSSTYQRYLARPQYMLDLIDGYAEQIDKLGVENIAFRSLGNILAGDYNEKRFVSRETSMNLQKEKLAELNAEGKGIMVQRGYEYAAVYADFITDIPLSSQGFEILDYDIPFYQIVLHGLVPYAGRPVNQAEDYRLNILRSIEQGAGLYFSFMQEGVIILQETRFHHIYANEYAAWADEAEALLKEFNEQVGDTYNQYITDYQVLRNGVSLTEYENGVKVIVNKTSAPYNYNGRTVEPCDYIVIRG